MLGSTTRSPVSIYDRVGGHEGLEAVVEDFYNRVLGDDQLSGFFAGTNMNRMKGRSAEFFAAALGGPHPYTGLSMERAHQGRGITMAHFDLVVGHLEDALAAVGVPQETVEELIGVIAPLAEVITSKDASTATRPNR